MRWYFLSAQVKTRDAGDEAYVCPLHCLRTPVNEERKVVVRATMNRTRQEGLSGTRGDVKIGADEVLRRVRSGVTYTRMQRVQAKNTDAMVAPVKNVKGSEVLSSFPSASARRKAATTLHSEGCWVVKSYLPMRTLPEGLGVTSMPPASERVYFAMTLAKVARTRSTQQA
ncbi:hypothetical protein F5J12DRAFT_808683 [Pisolithus orientalis]|uniref:uncharacterized protein n=1 Tax=Pisolithus orientalis TaxID=936130 RepID=UPI0022246CD4|nr:uncharacterized protein F5J12DRAFT_850932 [Pisolithus orientalis]XP_051603965.1 uncharacterized protein F5J12DRAFT_808683 [Pisolithus orientalis]KAI5997629.1 hypothetical protein F5J12DRAFT_850932 [Pisolithus orientalis]KAI6028923.1 hypothetical protein F5J12DRAFT_808683 [Pisolithus orientalis]